MLRRCAVVSGNADARFIDQFDIARDSIGAVFRDLDPRRANRVGQGCITCRPDPDAKRARGAFADRMEQVIQSGAARRNERLAPEMERRTQAVGTKSGMGAGATVIEHIGLLAFVDFEPVGNPSCILGIDEAALDMAVVAERFCL
jgi:hypothetical protein